MANVDCFKCVEEQELPHIWVTPGHTACEAHRRTDRAYIKCVDLGLAAKFERKHSKDRPWPAVKTARLVEALPFNPDHLKPKTRREWEKKGGR